MSGQGSSPRVLVAPDKFKGSLTADQAAEALARGIRDAAPTAAVEVLPVADGGDGTVDAALSAGFARRTVTVTGPTGLPVDAVIAVREGRAVVEVANTAGLSLVPESARDAAAAHSSGVGEAVAAALDLGVSEIVLGLGGSASTDGGSGMLRALGARFLDAQGADLPLGGGPLALLDRVDVSGLDPRLGRVRFVVAADVDSPLLGPTGAATMFSPQKGADAATTRRLEVGLARFADVTAGVVGERREAEPRAGAAGGLGFAALAYLGATSMSGAQVVLDLLELPSRVACADLVVTGEGRLDQQSLHGKAPVAVARIARSEGVPVVAAVGSCALTRSERADAGFAAVYELVAEDPDPRTCHQDAARLLSLVGRAIVRDGWVAAAPDLPDPR